jgi:hypothetical protein
MEQEKKLSALAAGAVAMSLLLGASAAQAATVIFADDAPTRAIGIQNLDVPGESLPYNIDFLSQKTAREVYGDPPGEYTFSTSESAAAAVDAINAALTASAGVGEEVLDVGDGVGTKVYSLGWSFEAVGEIESVNVWEGAIPENLATTWIRPEDPDLLSYNFDERTYAVATVVPVPAAVWLFGSGLLGLIGISRRKKA